MIARTALATMIGLATALVADDSVFDLGTRREVFADLALIDRMEGVRLELARPRDEGPVLSFDAPWEGKFAGYTTLLRDGDQFLAYYRGMPTAGSDGSTAEVTCLATSTDGVHWTKPKLGLFEVDGSRDNNVVLAGLAPFSHNFCPMIDTRPGAAADERFKALAGISSSGLCAFVSADGKEWKKLAEEPVISRAMIPFAEYVFDSQNLAFWSPAESKYVAFVRVGKNGIRRIARLESEDFLHWSSPQLMEYTSATSADVPIEHLYTSQTQPYFRAPHLYVAIAARFLPGRQVLSEKQAASAGVDPGYFRDVSDAILMTSRGGPRFRRDRLEGFIRPGLGVENWASRTNYPALGVQQTSPTEMSLYVNQNYAQPTAHLRRYALRLDGFASLRGPYEGGECVTHPIRFDGNRLAINFATSAAGGVQVEIQDSSGDAIPGFSLAEADEIIGNEIDRTVTWKGRESLDTLRGKVVRLRIRLHDADLYALQFPSN